MGSKFDPFSQNVTFHYADGSPFDVPVIAVDNLLRYCIRICINYGAQLGATIAIFVILMLLTRPEKRASSVFILNSAALVLNAGRLICQLIYFTSDFVKVYAYFSGDFTRVLASAYADSIIGVVLMTLLLICMEISLLLQTQVVCVNLRRSYRRILLVASTVMALIPIGFRMGFMVLNCQLIMSAISPDKIVWMESATNIVITISICFFCIVFVTKLGFAIRLRRRLGVRDFGPMKVIFIMGCQTLIIPAIFSILQYITNFPELASNLLTLVTISLPLSSIWAATTLNNSAENSVSSSRGNLWNVLSFSNSSKSKQLSPTTTTTASMCVASTKPNTMCYADQQPSASTTRDEGDLEQGEISVKHDISVHSYRKDMQEGA